MRRQIFHLRTRHDLVDASGGFYYYRARFYDPSLGRFIQRDPLGFADGFNYYAYVGNNPLSFSDPFGTKKLILRYWANQVELLNGRLWEGFPTRARTLQDLVSDAKSKVGSNFDATGQCGNCISLLIIVGHSGPGTLILSDSDAMTKFGPNNGTVAPLLSQLKGLFCKDGRIEFRQCDVACGNEGTEALHRIAKLAGVPATGFTEGVYFGFSWLSNSKTVRPDGSVVVSGDPDSPPFLKGRKKVVDK